MKQIFVKFFSTISGYFRRAAARIAGFAKKEGPIVVGVIDTFRLIMDNPLTDIAVKLTPTTLDDELVAKAKVALPKVLIGMNIVRNVPEGADLVAILSAAKEALDQIDPKFLRGYWKSIGTEVGIMVADGKIDWADVGHGIQFAVDEIRAAQAKKVA